jgi:transketolase
MDAVQQAKSGHPGMPMAMAPVAYLVYNRCRTLYSSIDPCPADSTKRSRSGEAGSPGLCLM